MIDYKVTGHVVRLPSKTLYHFETSSERTQRAIEAALADGISLSTCSDYTEEYLDPRQEDPAEFCSRFELGRKALARAEKLPTRQRKLIFWRLDGCSLAEVGRRLGLTREMARLIEKDALAELRGAMES